MKRTPVRALVAAIAVAASLLPAGADDADPFTAMSAAVEAFRTDGLDAAIAVLSKAIDDTRIDGAADPSMAPAFGMLADSLRNSGDLEGALAMAEEGLALVARDPAPDPLARIFLTVSRAYALGALGRHDPAIAAADAALPGYREAYGAGDSGVAALEAERAVWVEARRDALAERARAAWAEADRLEAGGEAAAAMAALPSRREAVRLYEEAGGLPKSLASALAALASTASTAGELAEAREAAVRAVGMVDVLADEPPSELASLFLIVANVFYLQGRLDTAAGLQSRAILLYGTGRDGDDAFGRFVLDASERRNPFAGFDTDETMRPLLRRALIEFGDTCRQLGILRLAGDAYSRAAGLVPEGDARTGSAVAVRLAAAAVVGGDPDLARSVLDDALAMAREDGDPRWVDLLSFWKARVDIGMGDAAEDALQEAASRFLAPLDATDPNAIRIRLELVRSLRQSPAGRRDPKAILEAARGAERGVTARLSREGREISADADLGRQNAREVFALFVAAAWEAGSAEAGFIARARDR